MFLNLFFFTHLLKKQGEDCCGPKDCKREAVARRLRRSAACSSGFRRRCGVHNQFMVNLFLMAVRHQGSNYPENLSKISSCLNNLNGTENLRRSSFRRLLQCCSYSFLSIKENFHRPNLFKTLLKRILDLIVILNQYNI